MKLKKNKTNIIIIMILIICFIVVFGVFAQSLINRSEREEKRVYLNYNERSTVNYNAYLKENPYFSVNSLGKGYRYISALIDYIDTNMQYNLNFSDYVNGNYSYYIKATLVTKEKETSNILWQETYNLKDTTSYELKNATNISVNENINIDYDMYYHMINDFRSDYSVLVDSILNVELVINMDIDYNKFSSKVINQQNVSLSIPLSEVAYDITLYNAELNNSNSFSEITEEGKMNNRFKYIGYIMWSIDILIIFITLIFVYKFTNKKTTYEKKKNKILKGYDSIIATVNTLPSLESLNIISVSSFDELVDVQNELRIPISYKETIVDFESWFILIHQQEAWVYKLNALELERNKKEIFKI